MAPWTACWDSGHGDRRRTLPKRSSPAAGRQRRRSSSGSMCVSEIAAKDPNNTSCRSHRRADRRGSARPRNGNLADQFWRSAREREDHQGQSEAGRSESLGLLGVPNLRHPASSPQGFSGGGRYRRGWALVGQSFQPLCQSRHHAHLQALGRRTSTMLWNSALRPASPMSTRRRPTMWTRRGGTGLGGRRRAAFSGLPTDGIEVESSASPAIADCGAQRGNPCGPLRAGTSCSR